MNVPSSTPSPSAARPIPIAKEPAGPRKRCPTPRPSQGSGRAAAQSLQQPAGVRRKSGVPRRSFHGNQQGPQLRNPCPGDACLSRSPWASAKQLASWPLAMSASMSPKAVAVSPSKRSVSCPRPRPMSWPASCRAASIPPSR